MHVYVGAYTEAPLGTAEGIYGFQFVPESGALNPLGVVADTRNPSFLALSGDQRFLYAVNELQDGGVSAFARNPETGALTFLNKQASHGADPCFISLDRSGRFAFIANYSGGTISVLPIAADGSLKPASCVIEHEGAGATARQAEPHPHMIASTPDGRYVLATDLGADQVVIYELDAVTGQLSRARQGPGFAKTESGAGPRHFAFAPNGSMLYVINELGSTLTLHDYDADQGELRPRQTVSSLPEEFDEENTCAQVLVSPDGRFVYGSNRGHNSIAIWKIHQQTGELAPVGHESTRGVGPRNFNIDPTGSWLLAANEKSHTVVTFRRNHETGELSLVGEPIEVPSPVAILFTDR